MSNIIVNHLLFADDAVIFAPSAKGLQQLLDICSELAATHNVVFNVKKSQCLIVASKNNVITRPNFQLCGAGLPYADSYKYLGHIISSDLSDNVDIMRQTRCLYARANTIIRKFNCALLNTKLILFRAFCMPIYGCQLWCSMSQYAYNKLHVAYNDGFRQLLNERRWCSASKLFVFNDVPVYAAVTRKLIYSLWCTVFNSGNVLLRGLVNSDLYVQSPLFRRWRIILYKL